VGALKDCEAIVGGLLGQPVNSLTTLAFVAGGLVVWARTRRRLIAMAMIATGIGSWLFHGPMPPYAQVVHDVTLWLLVGMTLVAMARDLTGGGDWRPLLGPLALLAGVAVIGRLGATGGPLCDPESVLQPHGLWHVGAAAAVTWWALTTGGRPPYNPPARHD
jgi:hypothetical protein